MYVEMPETGSSCMPSLSPTGVHGTIPAGGENIDVFIERRSHVFRLTIVIDKVVIVIDVP